MLVLVSSFMIYHPVNWVVGKYTKTEFVCFNNFKQIYSPECCKSNTHFFNFYLTKINYSRLIMACAFENGMVKSSFWAEVDRTTWSNRVAIMVSRPNIARLVRCIERTCLQAETKNISWIKTGNFSVKWFVEVNTSDSLQWCIEWGGSILNLLI